MAATSRPLLDGSSAVEALAQRPASLPPEVIAGLHALFHDATRQPRSVPPPPSLPMVLQVADEGKAIYTPSPAAERSRLFAEPQGVRRQIDRRRRPARLAAAGACLADDGQRMTDERTQARDYRPEIDGLRAIAVIPVVLFHLGLDWLRGGYLGVDVFFVISGFLITSIVLADLRSGRFTFREFLARRIRRIFPPLIVMVGCTLLAAWALTPTFDHSSVGKQAIAALLSVANVYFWKTSGDYWGLQSEQLPLLHTWSLSVEEQFYLLFPLAIWIMYRWRPSWLPAVLASLAALSLRQFLQGLESDPTGTFYLLPTRAWELAVGCTLATVARASGSERPVDSAWVSWLAIAGLGMILATYSLLPEMNGGVVVTVAGAALVLAFAGSGPCRALLSLPPLVFVGKASYSLYLWHWPFLVFAWHPAISRSPLLACGLSCIAAFVSHEWIEKPTRRRPGILPAIGAGYLAVLAAAFVMTVSKGEYDTTAFHRPVTHAHYYNLGDPGGSLYKKAVARKGKMYDLVPPTSAADAYREGGIIVGNSPSPHVVVLGDSHGAMWAKVIDETTSKKGLTTSFQTADGVTPFVRFPLAQRPKKATGFDRNVWNECRLRFIEEWRPDIVFVCARWSIYDAEDASDLLAFLQRHAGRTLLVEQPPELAIVDRPVIQWLAYTHVVPEPGRRVWLPEGNREGYERGRSLIRRLAAEFPGCEIVPVADLYARDSEVLVLDGREVVYLDDDHLTDFGTQLAAGRFEAAIAGALRHPQGGETEARTEDH
ncbi:MAG: acyltransferase [Planctomycetia bacterium]|nr:acyltransferase [Planctomycetia bacterium]